MTGTFVRANEDGERPQRVVTPFVVSREFGYAPCGADGDPELYDIASDPLAENNIASSSPSAVKEMQSVLQSLPGGAQLAGRDDGVLASRGVGNSPHGFSKAACLTFFPVVGGGNVTVA